MTERLRDPHAAEPTHAGVIREGPAHLIPLCDETVILPGAWVAERHPIPPPEESKP